MKKIIHLLSIAVLLMAIAFPSLAQNTLWGTYRNDAFYHIQSDGTGYSETFKNFQLGDRPTGRLIWDWSFAFFGSTNSTIYRVEPGGEYFPAVLYHTDEFSIEIQHTTQTEAGAYIVGIAKIPDPSGAKEAVFRIRLDGTNFKILKTFDVQTEGHIILSTVESTYNIYGIRTGGGNHGHGVIFRIGEGGDGAYTEPYHFANTQEKLTTLLPYTSYDDSFYGASAQGGSFGKGAIFNVFIEDGVTTTMTKLVDFGDPETAPPSNVPVLAAENPVGLIGGMRNLYGVSKGGGTYGKGTLFFIDATIFLNQNTTINRAEILHHFTPEFEEPSRVLTYTFSNKLFGIGGHFHGDDEDRGYIYSYDVVGNEGFQIVEDFNHNPVVAVPVDIMQGRDWLLYGTAENSNQEVFSPITFSMNLDGSNTTRLFQYIDGGNDPTYIANLNDEVVGLFGKGGIRTGADNSTGFVFKITDDELDPVHTVTSNTTSGSRITPANDGYVYIISDQSDRIARVDIDGTSADYLQAPEFASEAPLSATAVGVFGTSYWKGANSDGFIFKLRSDFSGVDVIYDFYFATGSRPRGKVIQGTNGLLYGTTSSGSGGHGTVFRINADGSNYTTLHVFNGLLGSEPWGGLVSDGAGNLYGTTLNGGQNGEGTIYSIKEDGTGFTSLFSFQQSTGRHPKGDLLLDNTTLYGLTFSGGQFDQGSLFKIATDGTGFQKLKDFERTPLDNLALVASSPATTYVENPSDGKTNISVKPRIQFVPVPDAVQYTLELSETSDFSGAIITGTSASPFVNTLILKYSTTYYARVKTDLSTFGIVTSFTTHAPEKYAFVSNPGDGATTVAADNLKVTANTVYGATSYTIELNTSPDFTGTSFVQTSAVPNQRTLTFTGLAYSTKYYGRVRTNYPSDWGPVRSFTTTAQPSRITSPANNATEVSALVYFQFQSVPNATSYTLEVSLTPTFDEIYRQVTAPDNQTISRVLEYSKTFYARVKTNNTAYGPVVRFTTHAPEKYSFVSSPVNGATNVATNNLKVTANQIHGASSYTIELNTSPDFTGTSIVKNSTVFNQRTMIFDGLLPGTTYYNRTRTNLPSNWGPVRSFTTAGSPPPAPEFVAKTSGVRVYPNPFITNFTAEVPEGNNVNLAIFDVTGKQVIKASALEGQSLKLGDDLSQGIYILKIQDGANVTIHRMIKQ